MNDQIVSFDASNSRYDDSLEDTTLLYKWDFDTASDSDGNGTNNDDDQANKVNPVYTYEKPGEYKVRLTVKDQLATEDIVERKIAVGQGFIQKNGIGGKNESLKLSSKNLLSTLDLSMPDGSISKGTMVDIKAKIIQANGEIYSDIVNYKLIE